MTNNRPAFLLTGALMVLIMLISLGAFLLVMHGFVAEIAPTIPNVMTDVPTLYDYDEFGEKITEFGGLTDAEVEAEIQLITTELEDLNIQRDTAYEYGTSGLIPILDIMISSLESELNALNYQGLSNPTIRLELYWMFAYPALAISFIFIIFASAAYYFEKGFSIFQRGTSMKIIKTSVLGMVAIILLPEFWDIYAIEMKQFSMYLRLGHN